MPNPWKKTGYGKIKSCRVHISGAAAKMLGRAEKGTRRGIPFDIHFEAPPCRTEFSQAEYAEMYARHGVVNPRDVGLKL